MNAKRIVTATVAAIALSPFAAFAPSLGQLHPVEVQASAPPSTVTRAEVRAELARHGVPRLGA